MVRERLVKLIQNLAPTPVAWIAIAVGVSVHIVGFFLFRVEIPGFMDFTTPEPYVSFVELGAFEDQSNLRDQALLSDSVPLFLPSEFDYGWPQLQPETYLDNQNPRMLSSFDWSASLGPEDIIEPPATELKHLDPLVMLDGEFWQTFRSLGERAPLTFASGDRFAVMEFQLESSREAIAEFAYAENPLEVDVSNVLWRPVELLLLVRTEGSMGVPVLLESSGITALDQYVIREAQQVANLRLVPEGYFRVRFGP